MDTTGDDPEGANASHGTYGQNGNLQNQDGRSHDGHADGIDGKFLSDKPASKPNSSKNKQKDGNARDERAHSQTSKHSKPPNQSATDTIDTNSQANPKVGVKSSLIGKQQYNNGQNVRASISKEVSTSQNQHTVQPRQTSKKFDNCVTKLHLPPRRATRQRTQTRSTRTRSWCCLIWTSTDAHISSR